MTLPYVPHLVPSLIQNENPTFELWFQRPAGDCHNQYHQGNSSISGELSGTQSH